MTEHTARDDRRTLLVIGGLVALLAIPLAIALGVLLSPRWYPLLDMSQTELRVRDVWSSHPPLIGLAGRIGPFGPEQGSHLGPMSFWSLWPFYQLFGAGSWALEVASVVLHLIAAGTALWLAKRRGGLALVLGVALVLAIVMHAYGALLLTQPWNPYLPVLWWFVFLLAVWSVLCGDAPAMPVVVIAGTFCVQTHISYLGLIGGLGAVAIAVVAYTFFTRRTDAVRRRRWLTWGGVALAIGVVLWIPPVIDQLVHDPGNLSVVRDHFSHPPETPVGLSEGLRVFFAELNPWNLTKTLASEGQTAAAGGSVLPGIAFLLVWGASALGAWRMRVRSLVRLDVVLAAATVFGAISATRIFGFVWYYLLLWVAAISGLMLLAIGWTVAELVRRRSASDAREREARFAMIGMVGLMCVVVVAFSYDATSAEIPAPSVSETVGALAPAAAAALAERPHDAPYLLTWLPDPLTIGGAGYGMLDELERRGFDVRAEAANRPGATPYRVMRATDASLEVHLAIGGAIAAWRRDHPEFEELAYHDPRTPKQRAEYARLRSRVIDDLAAAGLDELRPAVDENLFALELDERVPEATRHRLSRMAQLGLPGAVFLGPPVTSP